MRWFPSWLEQTTRAAQNGGRARNVLSVVVSVVSRLSQILPTIVSYVNGRWKHQDMFCWCEWGRVCLSGCTRVRGPVLQATYTSWDSRLSPENGHSILVETLHSHQFRSTDTHKRTFYTMLSFNMCYFTLSRRNKHRPLSAFVRLYVIKNSKHFGRDSNPQLPLSSACVLTTWPPSWSSSYGRFK